MWVNIYRVYDRKRNMFNTMALCQDCADNYGKDAEYIGDGYIDDYCEECGSTQYDDD